MSLLALGVALWTVINYASPIMEIVWILFGAILLSLAIRPLAVALYFALTFGLGLTVLRVPFALTIALVSGVLEVMPYVGETVAVILGTLSALTVTPWLAVWVILLWVVVVEIKGHIIEPAFYGRAIHIHPAAVLVALLIGVKAKGIVGVFFAVPVAVVLLTLIEEIQSLSDNRFKRSLQETNDIITDSPQEPPASKPSDREEKLLVELKADPGRSSKS